MGKMLRSLIFCAILNSIWTVEGSSPVVIWTLKRIGEANVQSNLNEFSAEQFADLLAWKTEQGNIPIIAFGLDSLSLEDLTPQGSVGSTEPFRKLRKITDASAETLLYPAVQSAGDSIALLQSKGFQVLQIEAGDALPKIEVSNTILVISEKASVNMDDEVLRVFSKYTLDFPNIMGMLWGKHSTWTEEPDEEVNEISSRKKRQAPAPEPNVWPITGENGLFMVFREVVLTVFRRQSTDKNSAKFVNATGHTAVNGSDATVLTLSFPNAQGAVKTTKFDVVLKLEKDRFGYWSMTNATASLEGSDSVQFKFDNVRLSSAVPITIPVSQSFHCTRWGSLRPTDKAEDLKQNHTFTIDFIGFQIQSFLRSPTEEKRFAPEYECVGFFTPGIWCGIFVTIILLSILTWGMKMIMDVKTMDRFDDPKGKPISFGSGE